MGLTAALIGVGIFGGAAANKLLNKTPKAPVAPTIPAAPTLLTSGSPDGSTPDKQASKASERRKRIAAGSGGRSSTLLTGPKGLGEIGSENTQSKTLLGY